MSEFSESGEHGEKNENKYKIEENIDFYALLQEENEVDYNDNNKCLITHEELNETAVTLECNHSFNYLPLYKYVLNSKTLFNNMEKNRLKVSQVKCPFCRHIQGNLLPLPPDCLDVKKIHGVNCIEYSSIMVGKCEYPDVCCKSSSVYLAYHDNKKYCFNHRTLMKKQWEKEEKQKHRCQYIYVRGSLKGIACGGVITKNISCGLCYKHSKIQNKKN
jgi:hypothetical protein